LYASFNATFQDLKIVGETERTETGRVPAPAIGTPPDQNEKHLLHGETGIETMMTTVVIGETTERGTRGWLLGENESVHVSRSASWTTVAGQLEKTGMADAIRETLVVSEKPAPQMR
jgi:hypothetical protein